MACESACALLYNQMPSVRSLRAIALAAAIVAACAALLPGSAAAQPEPPPPAAPQPEPPPPAAPQPEPAAGAPSVQPVEQDPGATTPPVLEDQGVPEPLAPTGGIEVDSEPPVLWQNWTIAGDLSASERDTLYGFFAPEMRTWQSLSKAGRDALASFALTIGYELTDLTIERMQDGSNLAVLHLAPIPLVRRVEVEIASNVTAFYRFDTIFADEITRRMSLRPGASLELDPRRRKAQLAAEAERIADYLRTEGFFEARVAIEDKPAGDGALALRVIIVKGPQYEIGRIQVQGNESVTTKEIVDMFRHGQFCVSGWCLIERFSLQAMNNDVTRVEELYRKRGFPAVRVTTDFNLATSFNRLTKKVDFTVLVYERRKIDVVFEGNNPRAFPTETLETLLTFDQEGSYDDVEVESSAIAIRRYYQSRGHFEATVTVQRERFSFFERIVFTIDAGPRLQVRKVSFEGNQAIGTGELAALVATQVPRSSPIFGGSGYATSEQIEADLRRIEKLYKERGYAEVRVEPRMSRTEDKDESIATLAAVVASGVARGDQDGLYVRFLVTEGPQTVIEDVRFVFDSEHERDQASLRRVVGMGPSEPFTEERVLEGKSALERFYFENARPHASIEWRVQDGSTPRRKIVTYRVKENQLVRFGKILVRGNFKTADWVILDELGFREGAPLTLGRAEAGQQNLRLSGLFNAVQVKYIKLDQGKESDINVLVQVEERHDYKLGIEGSLGYSSDSSLFGELGLFNANLGGTGMRTELRVRLGTELRLGEVKFIAPQWAVRRATRAVTGGLLELAPRFEVGAFYRQDTTERFGDLVSRGASAAVSRLGRRGFFRNWLISLRYDYRQRRLDEDLVRSVGASNDIEQAKVDTSTGAFGPQLVIDKRKDDSGREYPLVPTRGFKLELRALYADTFLFGQNRFIKLGGSIQHFYKPFGRLLISNGVRYDHGIPLGQSILPEVERFFAGGDTTVRGFEEDRLATEIIEEAVPPLGDVTRLRIRPAGGNVRFIYNLDFQIDVWKLWGSPVASAVFWDAGLITNSLDGAKIADVRHALGVALFRWVSPFGALSAEWAIPLDPELGDNPRGRFHFNFGLPF